MNQGFRHWLGFLSLEGSGVPYLYTTERGGERERGRERERENTNRMATSEASSKAARNSWIHKASRHLTQCLFSTCDIIKDKNHDGRPHIIILLAFLVVEL